MAKKKKRTKVTWTKDEIKLLKKLFGNKTSQEVADELGRPLYSIKMKASRTGLKKTKKHIALMRRNALATPGVK